MTYAPNPDKRYRIRVETPRHGDFLSEGTYTKVEAREEIKKTRRGGGWGECRFFITPEGTT